MGKKSTKTTNEPWSGAKPFILGAANNAQDAYNSNSGNIQNISDGISGLVPGMLERYGQGDPNLNAATNYNVDVLSGQYLNGNPYLDDIIGRSINDSTNSTQAAMGLRGLTGGSDYANIIGKNAGNIALDARYGDYNQERSRMATAAGQAPGMVAAEAQRLTPLLSAQQAAMAPINAASQYTGSIGGLMGGYGTQTQPGGWGQQLLGTAAQLGSAAIMASERRVKKDIEQVGALEDGLGVYRFRYKTEPDDAPLHYGVMVDEVEKLRPHALGPVIDGIQHVDYSKLEAA